MTDILAIDFGGTRTRAAWFDDSLTLIERNETLSNVQDSAEIVIQRIIDVAKTVIPEGHHPGVIGISAPGPLDAEQGIIYQAKTLPQWQSVPLAQYISEAFDGAATYMNNDANLAALAEYRFGAGRDCNPMLYLTISTGIGGGAIIDGKLFTGWRGLAIEPGHMRLTLADGRDYRLEELASGTALGNWARKALETENADSLLRNYQVIDGRAVGKAALEADPFALKIVENAGKWLGLGLVNLIHLFNPEAIVLGGSVTRLGDLILNPARQTIQDNLLDKAFYQDDLIRIAALGDDVCLYGAAYYAFLKLS